MSAARPSAAALVLAAALLCACGRPSADLFVVERTGSVPGARLTLLVSDGGFVRCNGGQQRQMTSGQLIEARELARELNGDDERPGPAAENLELPPRAGSILRYDVRAEAGSVSFSDTSRGQPPAFFRLQKLTRDLAQDACGLAR